MGKRRRIGGWIKLQHDISQLPKSPPSTKLLPIFFQREDFVS